MGGVRALYLEPRQVETSVKEAQARLDQANFAALRRAVVDLSETFRVLANMPISVQPLDAEGKALQVMRSWFTAMPGEKISCVGCDEQQSDSPTIQRNVVALKQPVDIESDIHLLTPMDFHADTPELVQMLQKGHNGVQLDAESWGRLITWIDLNVPYHGTWIELAGEEAVKHVAQRRREMTTAFSYGESGADFSPLANLSDARMREIADNPYQVYAPLGNATKYNDWVPRDGRFSDGQLVSAEVEKYKSNAWGVHDMHGNVWEWTASAYVAYPYVEADGRNALEHNAQRVARGGSWYERPKRATSSFRLAYRPYQRVFNVGFRVVGEVTGDTKLIVRARP